jgi:hypothetical protein
MTCEYKETSTRRRCVKVASNKAMDSKCEIKEQTSRCVLKKKQPVVNKKQPVVNKKQPVVNKKQPVVNEKQPVVNKKQHVVNKKQNSFREKIFEPGDILYHGTKKKIDFCQLGAECEIEPYGFSTNDYAYAKAYAGDKGRVTAWTPIKKLRILVLSRTSLSAAIDWVKSEYKEKYIDDKVAKKISTKEFLMQAFKVVNLDVLFKKLLKTKGKGKFDKTSMYEEVKKMKPYEFFGTGDRFNKNKAKEIRKLAKGYKMVNHPGGLKASRFHCGAHTHRFDIKTRERMNKENVSCAPISLTNNGFFRKSFIGYDVGMYHYLFKYLKHMKYDGVKLITNGFGNNINKRTDEEKKKTRVEFVIDNKSLKKVNLPDFTKNIDKNLAEKEKQRKRKEVKDRQEYKKKRKVGILPGMAPVHRRQ